MHGISTAMIDGLRIRYCRVERPGARTLLMTGAWPQSLLCFEPMWPALREHFDLLAIDLPGFGQSEAREGIMRPSAQADFLMRVATHFGLRDIHLLALDVGVPAGLFALARFGERFASATLANGPGCHPPRFALPTRLLARSSFARSAVSLAPGLFVRVVNRDGHTRFRPSDEALSDYVKSYAGQRLAQSLGYLGSYAEELPMLDAELALIHTRVAVLWGTEDVYLETENANAIASRLPNAQVRLLEGAGHFSHEDAAHELVAHLTSWC